MVTEFSSILSNGYITVRSDKLQPTTVTRAIHLTVTWCILRNRSKTDSHHSSLTLSTLALSVYFSLSPLSYLFISHSLTLSLFFFFRCLLLTEHVIKFLSIQCSISQFSYTSFMFVHILTLRSHDNCFPPSLVRPSI